MAKWMNPESLRALILWLAVGLIAFLYFKNMTAVEAFKMDGWLDKFGEFDWIEAPAWLAVNEESAEDEALTNLSFSETRPLLIAIEPAGKDETDTRRLKLSNGDLVVDNPSATNIVETQAEIWAVMRSSATSRYMIRSGSPAGEYIKVDDRKTCENLGIHTPADPNDDNDNWADWIIEPAQGTKANTFFIRTRKCNDTKKYYLGVQNGNVVMLPETVVPTDPTSVSWEFRAIIGPASEADLEEEKQKTATTTKTTPKTTAKTAVKAAQKAAVVAKGAATVAKGAAKSTPTPAAKGAAAAAKGAAVAAKGAAAAAKAAPNATAAKAAAKGAVAAAKGAQTAAKGAVKAAAKAAPKAAAKTAPKAAAKAAAKAAPKTAAKTAAPTKKK